MGRCLSLRSDKDTGKHLDARDGYASPGFGFLNPFIARDGYADWMWSSTRKCDNDVCTHSLVAFQMVIEVQRPAISQVFVRLHFRHPCCIELQLGDETQQVQRGIAPRILVLSHHPYRGSAADSHLHSFFSFYDSFSLLAQGQMKILEILLNSSEADGDGESDNRWAGMLLLG